MNDPESIDAISDGKWEDFSKHSNKHNKKKSMPSPWIRFQCALDKTRSHKAHPVSSHASSLASTHLPHPHLHHPSCAFRGCFAQCTLMAHRCFVRCFSQKEKQKLSEVVFTPQISVTELASAMLLNCGIPFATLCLFVSQFTRFWTQTQNGDSTQVEYSIWTLQLPKILKVKWWLEEGSSCAFSSGLFWRSARACLIFQACE